MCSNSLDNDDIARFVINFPSEERDENFVQAVRVEKCLYPEEPCNLETCDDTTTVCRYFLRLGGQIKVINFQKNVRKMPKLRD